MAEARAICSLEASDNGSIGRFQEDATKELTELVAYSPPGGTDRRLVRQTVTTATLPGERHAKARP